MALVLNHQTPAEFQARFWRKLVAAYEAGDKYSYHKWVYWLWVKIQDGDLTSDQVRQSYNTHFGKSLNPAQWNANVVPHLTAIRDRWLAWQAETMV